MLAARGFTVASDVGSRAAGDDWRRAMEREARAADTAILVIGPHQRPDETQELAWQAVLEAVWDDPGKQLIPILLRGARLPAFLRSTAVQPLELEDPEDLEEAVKAIRGPIRGARRSRLAERGSSFEPEDGGPPDSAGRSGTGYPGPEVSSAASLDGEAGREDGPEWAYLDPPVQLIDRDPGDDFSPDAESEAGPAGYPGPPLDEDREDRDARLKEIEEFARELQRVGHPG
jgi:TIR domain